MSPARPMPKSVLHLSPYAVSPPTYGGPLRTHNICSRLSHHYEVNLFCQQVRRQDIGWTFAPVLRQLTPTYSEYCPRNLVSLSTYAVFSRIGCPAFVQSELLQLSAPAWLQEKVLNSTLINVEHPWQFQWVHGQVGGRKPIVLTAHNVEAELSGARNIRAPQWVASFLRRQTLRREAYAMRNATRIFTMSPENSELIVGKYGIPAERCVVVPNGVDCEKFAPVSVSRRQARQRELGLAGKFVILFAGSSHGPNRQAVERIIEWATAWPDDRVRFLVAGSIGSVFAHVRHPRIVFSGPVDDMASYFEAADMAVNPLLSGSGTTLKQVEYMAMGLPSVATPMGIRGIPVSEGENAYVRRTGETPELLRWLMAHEEVREAVGRKARRFAEQYFDWSVVAKKVLDVYRELECLGNESSRPFHA